MQRSPHTAPQSGNTDVTVGVDIGGTNSVVGVVDDAGTLRVRKQFPTHARESVESFVPRLAHVISGTCEELSPHTHIRGIGIASPAASTREGIVDNPANFQWGRVDLAGLVGRYFDVPIVILNDGDAAVLGEARYGAARGMSNVLLMTLGTGLGAGILVDGRLVQGAHGAAGELGHMIVTPGGRECACGRRGCAETYVSASGVRRTAFELLAESVAPSRLRNASFEGLTTDHIAGLAAEGDELAAEAFRRTGHALGLLLANVVTGFDPEAIVLCGGLIHAGELLAAPARASFDQHVLERYRGKVRMLLSTLTDGEAAILGASALVRDSLSSVEAI